MYFLYGFVPLLFSPSLKYRKIRLSKLCSIRQLTTIILTTVTLRLALAQEFDWDCTNSLDACNNACFAVNCKDSPDLLTYDSNAANRDPRRTASGCNRNPCTNTRYKSFGNSCDEYRLRAPLRGAQVPF